MGLIINWDTTPLPVLSSGASFSYPAPAILVSLNSVLTAAMENSMEIAQQVKNGRATQQSHIWVCLQRIKTRVPESPWTPGLMLALFTLEGTEAAYVLMGRSWKRKHGMTQQFSLKKKFCHKLEHRWP